MVAALKVLGVAAALGGAIGLWLVTEAGLSAYARPRLTAAPGTDRVVLADAPAWMSPLVAEQLRQAVADHVSSDLLDPQSLRRAVAAVGQSPWVRRVRSIERTGSQIMVLADYRQPVALVEDRGEYYLVDGQAVRLLGIYFEHQLPAVNLPVLRGVKQGPADIGEVWPGDDVQAGLELLAFLASESYASQIRGVAVRDAQGQIRPVLLTGRPGGRVYWGRPIGEGPPIEVSDEIKRQRLAAVDAQRGSIDAGGKQVYVYGPAVFVAVEPEAEAATSQAASYRP